MSNAKLIPSLWFTSKDGNISEVLDYYKKIFGDNFESGDINDLGMTPGGKAQMASATIFGNTLSFMSTERLHHPFNDAMAFTINCKGQTEIDKYWDYFTKEGKESMCGWCQDKFGLRWQIIPGNFGELMSGPNSMKVMMSQKKIVINDYLT